MNRGKMVAKRARGPIMAANLALICIKKGNVRVRVDDKLGLRSRTTYRENMAANVKQKPIVAVEKRPTRRKM